MSHFSRFSTAFLLASSISGAQAAYTGSLSYIEPTGTVNSTDSIPVWVRLTLDPSSEPLVLNGDASGTTPFGVDPVQYPTRFYSTNNLTNQNLQIDGTLTRLDNVYINTAFGCSGTFTSSCTSGPAYDFNFNSSGPNTINNLNLFSLQPGQSHDYLFGTFTPTNGSAAPGDYVFYYTSLSLNFYGQVTGVEVDGQGNPVTGISEIFENASGNFDFAESVCINTNNQNCSSEFTRTVTAVPVPGAFWLFGSFLLGFRGLARNKKS